jgi:hypothetical protein
MEIFQPEVKPKLLWSLPSTERWAYVERSEFILIDLIKDELRIKPIHITQGFDPSHDARVDVPDEECTVDLEIKFTQSHNFFVECAYGNGVESGLLASKADFYVVVSRDLQKRDGQHIGKVRLYPHWRLVEYGNHKIDKFGIKAFEASEMSPGSQGFYVNSYDIDTFYGDRNAHIWVGDVDSYIDQDDNVTYDLNGFIRTSGECLRLFMCEVRKINRMKEQGLSNV